jgi:hypothetical protein
MYLPAFDEGEEHEPAFDLQQEAAEPGMGLTLEQYMFHVSSSPAPHGPAGGCHCGTASQGLS